MSFAEMVVPYRDSSFDHYRRTAYDIGEWGLGFTTTSLELGCDCLGEIAYVDAVLHDSKGEPYEINAICIHEEDNRSSGSTSTPCTGQRYEGCAGSSSRSTARWPTTSIYYWRFYEDGNIECEVRATGIMVMTPNVEGAEAPRTGTVVDNRTHAPFHQHFIVARLDLDVDGEENTVLEVDSEALPVSDDNPYGLDLSPMRGRSVRRPRRAGTTAGSGADLEGGEPQSHQPAGCQHGVQDRPWRIVPRDVGPATVQFLRSPVIGHTLWVTRHHEHERWPAGPYPTQSERDEGMTRWIADDEPLENVDLVLWYVFGIHHITRVEDWPIMPADMVSFWPSRSGSSTRTRRSTWPRRRSPRVGIATPGSTRSTHTTDRWSRPRSDVMLTHCVHTPRTLVGGPCTCTSSTIRG